MGRVRSREEERRKGWMIWKRKGGEEKGRRKRRVREIIFKRNGKSKNQQNAEE